MVALTADALANSPPVILSESIVRIFEDQQFIFNIRAFDPDGDPLSILLNRNEAEPSGQVSTNNCA